MINSQSRQRGALMIEVLVTIVIVVIGLLALFQMQERLQRAEMESYQRTQAMMLLNDMASRIETNRSNIMAYANGFDYPVGAGMVCSSIGATNLQEQDVREWCNALQGAAETESADDSIRIGAMMTLLIIGGRGGAKRMPNQVTE